MRFGGKRRRCGEPYSVASQCDKMNSHLTVAKKGPSCGGVQGFRWCPSVRNGGPLDQKARLGFRKRKVGVVFSNIEHIIGVGYT